MLVDMSSLFFLGLILLLPFASSQFYHANSMDILTLEGIELPIHTYGGIGGIFEHKLYAHSGFDCTQYECSQTTIPTIFVLDLEQIYLNTSLYWNHNHITNWSQIDYTYTRDSLAIYSGIPTASSSTQLNGYSYTTHGGTLLKYDLTHHQYTDASLFDHIIPSTQLSDSCNLNDEYRYLYSIGGRDTTDSSHVYRYDTLDDIWQILTDLNVARFAASCVIDNDSIYVLGGDNDKTKKKRCLSSIEKYDIQTDVWTLLRTNLMEERHQHISVLHPNHWIMSIGGINGRKTAVGVEILDPDTQYTATTNIVFDRTRFYYAMRHYPTATVLFLYGGMDDDDQYYDEMQYIVLSTSDHVFPTHSPTIMPSQSPTLTPTMNPTASPTPRPSIIPSVSPTMRPTSTPTLNPTTSTFKPSITPTMRPTSTFTPSFTPTIHVASTSNPTISPFLVPTLSPFQREFTSTAQSNSPTIHPSEPLTSQLSTTITEYTENDFSTSTDATSNALSSDSLNIESLWTLLTSNIAHATISALALIICCCGCCLCYFVHRSRKAHSQLSQKVDVVVSALKNQKAQAQFPHTVPSKSSTGTYKRDSALYDIDGYLNGVLASSPSSYLSSPHNRSYNSNARTGPSPSGNAATGANRQIGYRTVNHIAIPVGIDNWSDDDGEDSLTPNKLSICNSNSMSASDYRMDPINEHRKRSHTDWKQRQQQKQMVSYRNQLQWQFQRPRAVSYGQYHYQPYFRNYNGYYVQNNNNRNIGVPPPPPPVRLPAPPEAFIVPGLMNNNNAMHPRAVNVPPPPVACSDIKEEEDDEGDSVSTDLDTRTSSSAHSHTYADQEQEDVQANVDEDEEILSDISPMNSKFVSSNSLVEQKAELDEVTIRIGGDDVNSNKSMKRRRQMIVFKPQTVFNDASVDVEQQNCRFEPGAVNKSIQNAHSKNLTELIYDERRMDSVYESENDSDVDESNSFIRQSSLFDNVKL
eukprot:588858_1